MNVKSLLIITLWAVVIVFGVLQIGSSRLIPFDPDLRFSQEISDLDFDLAFVGKLAPFIGREKAHIIHFEQGDCMCEWIAKSHKNKIDALGKMQAMPSITIDLNVHPQFKDMIPATPAVAVIFNGQLRYLGPYSAGLGCLNNKGPVNDVLAYTSRSVFANPIIVSDSEGCYCHSQPN
jgi:hypothetical protein